MVRVKAAFRFNVSPGFDGYEALIVSRAAIVVTGRRGIDRVKMLSAMVIIMAFDVRRGASRFLAMAASR